MKTFTLNDGAKMPAFGLGTMSWQSSGKPGDVAHAVEHALRDGYDLIDAAWFYQNEGTVGEGIKASGRKREDIYVTTKVWGTYHANPEASVDESLRDLRLDYVDLVLLHWPIPLNPRGSSKYMPLKEDGSRDVVDKPTLEETWAKFEALLKTGKVKSIGVANMSPKYMERLLKTATIVPAVDQIELHPYLPQNEVVEWLQAHKVVPQAYSPLGSTSSPILRDETLLKLAAKYGCTVGQLCISWQVCRGVSVIPKSVTPSRISENAKLVDIAPEDVKTISSFAAKEGKTKRFIVGSWNTDFGFGDW